MTNSLHETEKQMPSAVVYHNPTVRHRYYLLIPHFDLSDFKILLQKNPDTDVWTLPSFEPQEHHFAVVQHINDYVQAELGISVATLRCFDTYAEEENSTTRFYALDTLSEAPVLTDNLAWFSEEELAELTLATNLQRHTIANWFQWRHSDDSLRSAWTRPNWFPKVSDWMIDLADRMSMTGIQTPKQARVWARSATARLETADGMLFFKAVPEFFNYEPVITRVLSIRYPERAPDVRAVHVKNGWMLMSAFQGKTLTHIDDFEMWERTVKEFARLQIDLISNTQSLIALGVPDRNVDYLGSQVERLMQNLPDNLSDEEKLELLRLAPTLRSMCYELAEFNLPLTLTHGDFWSGQVVFKDDGKCLFFDWSDASISHPFFDMCTFLAEVDSELPDVEEARKKLLMIYLNEWTRYESLDNLKQAYALSIVLAYLHQALFYHVHILPKVESAVRWELSGMLTHLLRYVLHEMKGFEAK